MGRSTGPSGGACTSSRESSRGQGSISTADDQRLKTNKAQLKATYVVLRSFYGHEALQGALVEDALWVLGGLVTHEAVDEGKRRLRDRDTSERQV